MSSSHKYNDQSRQLSLMNHFHDASPLQITSTVKVIDAETNEIIRFGKNAVHPQNMSRIIARALANEPNSIIHRIAFGNGGTFTDATEQIIPKEKNIGAGAGGWESRLYNETYSEIIDEDSILFGTDPGSAGSDAIRTGGGAVPADDQAGMGVTSTEAGIKSNITVRVFLNKNEPGGQLLTSDPSSDDCFRFDEIALYSPGKHGISTSGFATVDIGDKTSEDISNLTGNDVLTLRYSVDGTAYTSTVTVPASGSGPSGEITYGDIAEGINSGTWITAGTDPTIYLYAYITDRTGGSYPTITGKQSYGYLTFSSKTVGSSSAVTLTCTPNDASDFFNAITNNVCANCNVGSKSGDVAGVQNSPNSPEDERERLLAHFIFDPVLKTAERGLIIVYELTVSVKTVAEIYNLN